MRRILALIAGCLLSFSANAAEKHVLLIAGRPSHGMGQHEHIAGVLLFQKCLAAMPGLKVDVALGEWPKDRALLDSADAVVFYADGGRNHLALADDHLAILDSLAAKGVGIGLIHYAIEPTQEKGEVEFLRWVGGCFEINWSVNPAFNAKFDALPTHPITRGVRPFSGQDEWYYHLRFVDGMKGVTPLLVTTPGVDTLTRPDGPMKAILRCAQPSRIANRRRSPGPTNAPMAVVVSALPAAIITPIGRIRISSSWYSMASSGWRKWRCHKTGLTHTSRPTT